MHSASSSPAPPLLLFGGTFDPPHRAHLEIADRARRATGAAEVLFIPARQNPLKDGAPGATAGQRLEMLSLALAGIPWAHVSRIEVDRPGPSWFVETLRTLAAAHPDRTHRFILGSDQAALLHRWREPEAILALADPVIVLRPPHDDAASFLRDAPPLRSPGWWRHRLLDGEPLPHASTSIRDLCASGHTDQASAWLDPSVLAYIEAHGLYRAHGA
ncbi:MAG: nicotinate (nicotinamide) nucleotide adenylyltransferase [Phycisphaeraceae bacterium]|nr:nicotinate (nicotinamide) nucleotide adenylyltransferase [Phycisphaeraceae bacterium]